MFISFTLGLLLLSGGTLFAQNGVTHYRSDKEIQQALRETHTKYQAFTSLIDIAVSPGGNPVTLMEIGSNLKDVPAIFVGANFEGNTPLATEGAMQLIKMLLDSSEYTSGLKWYIMPQPNPDAAKNFFSKVKYGRSVNDYEINNDADDAVNEDGFNDLNGDGYITMMRVKNPSGTHFISKSDARIMQMADPSENETGEYLIYPEGIDDDKDGLYNEDGEGGINPGISFPHLFPENVPEAGLWPGQTPEVYGIMRFIYDHPEIAMVFTLGSSDFCISPPRADRKGDPDLNRIKLPGRFARMLGADESQTYSIQEIVAMMKNQFPAETEITPQMIAGMLGLGQVVNPLEEDLKFYTAFSDEYREFLKSKNFSTKRLNPEPAKDGSFELWAYYHLGVPSFSMNLFTVPLIKEEKPDVEKSPETDEIKKTGTDDLMNLQKSEPENKKENKEITLLKWSDEQLKGNGFADWQPYQHPQLGEVEIGGFLPYFESTPGPEYADQALKAQLPWLLKLSKKLPDITFTGEEISEMGAGIYRVTLYIRNNGNLSYPIAMGQRNNQPAPLIVALDGNMELLEGLKRTPVRYIGAGQVQKISWIINTKDKGIITAKIESAVFPDQVKEIKMK